jgi:c-di-AMP phosphodiesterase-like protein
VVIVYYNYYVAALGGVLLYVLYLYGRERQAEQQKQIQAYLDAMCKNVDQASLYALQKLPLAIAIVDETGILYWHNKVMATWVGEEVRRGEALATVWPELSIQDMWGQDSVKIVQAKGKYFQVIFKTMDEPMPDNHELMILYITDITSMETIRDKYRQAMPVLAHIQIDNYDDVLKGLNEAQRTGILAEVNQTLADWITEIDGFLKKYTEDTYIAVFNRYALDKLLSDKFEILDKIRDIHGGNKNPVTLSIGVASDDSSVALLEQRAQAGLDLSLGRGGDQASVYIEGQVQFYGGKAKPLEKNTRVKARMVAQAIREVLQDTEHVMVMGHFGEDFDSLGAALGVARMAQHLGKRVNIVTSQASLAFSKLREQFAEGSSYQSIFISPAQALLAVTPQSLLFVVDTHRPEMTAAPEILNQVEKVVVIDHHRRSEVFIKNPILVYLEPSASSASELVTELLNYFDEKLDLSRLDATALYAGIIVDTKNFAVQA